MPDDELGSHPSFACRRCGAQLTLLAISEPGTRKTEHDGSVTVVRRIETYRCANGHPYETRVVDHYRTSYTDDE